ncbi:MAG: hypothetical protein PHU72_10630, partial [Dethiosulfovibrio sp.]|nr:hypothetical protein [Dethiosulfovibrio sp.]
LSGGGASEYLDVGEFSLAASGGEDPGSVIGEAHLKDYMNPHRVTKEQIGLGAVDNRSSVELLNRANHTGVQPPTSIETDVSHQWMTLTEKNKLSTIQDRSNHTGVQPASSIQTDPLRQWITLEEKEKLATVERNANRYVHPPKHSADEINETSDRKFVTADEKALLGSVSGSSHGHLNKDILDDISAAFTETDKQKLDSIAYGLQPYVHPGTHPSTMIDEVGDKLFVSPEEKALWNAHAENQENPHGITKASIGLSHVDDTSSAELRDRATHTGVQPASSIELDEHHQFITQLFKTDLDNTVSLSHHHGNSLILNEITAAYTTEEKDKLADIEAEANKYVHPDTHSLSEITETDTLKVMTSAERTKLSGIAAGANAYTHPAAHPATMITEDASHRFVSDAEKTKWNTDATTTAKGVVELATSAEAQAGTDTTRAVTPAALAGSYATNAEALAGTTKKIITAESLRYVTLNTLYNIEQAPAYCGVSSEGGWHRIKEDGTPFYLRHDIDNAKGIHRAFTHLAPWAGIETRIITSSAGPQQVVRVPKFWYKRQGTGLAGDPYKLWISGAERAGYVLHPAFAVVDEFFVGAFACGGDKYESVEGLNPKTNITIGTAQSGITTNHGAGWNMWDIYQLSALQMLYLVEFGDPDAQKLIGAGNSGQSWDGTYRATPNGKTNAVYRGIHEFWGNVWQMVDGLRGYSGTTEAEIFRADGSRVFVRTGITPPASYSGSSMLTNAGTGFDLKAVNMYGPGGQAHFADSYWGPVNSFMILHGGGWADGSYCGVFSLSLSISVSYLSLSIGSRLAKV